MCQNVNSLADWGKFAITLQSHWYAQFEQSTIGDMVSIWAHFAACRSIILHGFCCFCLVSKNLKVTQKRTRANIGFHASPMFSWLPPPLPYNNTHNEQRERQQEGFNKEQQPQSHIYSQPTAPHQQTTTHLAKRDACQKKNECLFLRQR